MIQFRFREQATQQITLFTSRKLSTNSYSFRAMLNDEKVSEVLGLASELAAAALFDMTKNKEDDKWFDHKTHKQKMCTEFIIDGTATLRFIKSRVYSAESNMFCGLIFVTLDQSSNIVPLFG